MTCKDNSSEFTDNFIFWAKKLESWTDENWRQAFQQLDKKIEMTIAEGKDSYPPTYKEFMTYGKSPPRSQLEFSDPRHPEYEHHQQQALLKLQSPEQRQSAIEAGKAALKQLKELGL